MDRHIENLQTCMVSVLDTYRYIYLYVYMSEYVKKYTCTYMIWCFSSINGLLPDF